MTLETPIWLQEGTYPARLDRQLIAAIFSEGVLTGFTVSQRSAGANMSVDVSAGVAVIDGDDQSNQGAYIVQSTATENVAVSAAPGSNSRIDLVVLQVNDSNAGGGVGDDWEIAVIAGTPAASPSAPSVPASAIAIARITVSSSHTSIADADITDNRSFATLRHNVVDDAQATRLGTPNSAGGESQVMRRTSDGRASVSTPTQSTNIANKAYVDAQFPTSSVAANAVGSTQIVNGAVTEWKIGASAVTNSKLSAGAVTQSKVTTTWTELTNGSTWVRYMKLGSTVWVHGRMGTGLAVTLPAGFRPPQELLAPAYSASSTSPVTIKTDGKVSGSGIAYFYAFFKAA